MGDNIMIILGEQSILKSLLARYLRKAIKNKFGIEPSLYFENLSIVKLDDQFQKGTYTFDIRVSGDISEPDIRTLFNECIK